ncbi:GDSL-type esterase/lipase family protein [Streptomyces melanogenes]|uniref:GDSL-type esterase/lipase family protein n=1 Tax=Streptomyces melanogenes TaxID=67326 RepID=UPI00167DCD8F|nr:GDSL-type esterase/lipase family protein [Streptomyces melanogenes]GGP85825.1 hypothetical protein GCM10010278_75330 [Streptomyces melanogenes]
MRAALAISLTLSAGGTALAMNTAHGSAPQRSTIGSKLSSACAGAPASGGASSTPDSPSPAKLGTPAEPGAPAAPAQPAEPTVPDSGAVAEAGASAGAGAAAEAGASTGASAETGAGDKADPATPDPDPAAGAGADNATPPEANGDAAQSPDPSPSADGSGSPTCRGNEGKPAAIVSMGDSFISGEGGRWKGNGSARGNNIGSIYGTDLASVNCNKSESWCNHDATRIYGDTDGKCDRSNVAEIKGADVDGIPPERRFNIACSGAETQHVTSQTFTGERPQTEQLAKIASTNNVKVIALSIGGNDLKFADMLTDCAKNFLKPIWPRWLGGHPCEDQKEPEFTGRLERMKTGVASSLKAIRTVMKDAGYDDGAYTLVLQSYPNPLPAADQFRTREDSYARFTTDGAPFYSADANWARTSVIPKISTALRDLASSQKAVFLDLTNAFAGHELGAADSRLAASNNTLTSPLTGDRAEWIRWVGFPQGYLQEAVHPNYYGQKALSRCLTETIRLSTNGKREFSCTGAAKQGPESVTVS